MLPTIISSKYYWYSHVADVETEALSGYIGHIIVCYIGHIIE